MPSQPSQIIVPFKPYKAQRDVFKSKARWIVVRAGRRAGKTYLALYLMFYRALTQPKSQLLYVAPTNRQVQEIAFLPMLEMVHTVLRRKVVREKGNYQIHFTNGSKMYFRSAESRDQVLRGEHVDYLILDEVDYFPDGRYLWQSVLRPALMDTKGKVLAISSPDSEGGLISEFFDEWGQRDDGLAVQLRTIDNPNLDPAEIEDARSHMDEITYQREILGLPVGYSGLCFSHFDESKHVLPISEFPKKDKHFKYIGGLDYGVDDPTAILYAYLDYEGNCWVYDEFYQPAQTMKCILDSINDHRLPAKHVLFYDSAHPGVANEIKLRGVAICERSVKDTRPSIQRVNEWFHDGKLFIADHCDNLISDIKHYIWATTRTGKKLDKPAHDNSHGPDALRYMIYSMSLNAKAYMPKKPIPQFSVAALERDERLQSKVHEHIRKSAVPVR